MKPCNDTYTITVSSRLIMIVQMLCFCSKKYSLFLYKHSLFSLISSHIHKACNKISRKASSRKNGPPGLLYILLQSDFYLYWLIVAIQTIPLVLNLLCIRNVQHIFNKSLLQFVSFVFLWDGLHLNSKPQWLLHILGAQAELGTRQHYRDNVTMF